MILTFYETFFLKSVRDSLSTEKSMWQHS